MRRARLKYRRSGSTVALLARRPALRRSHKVNCRDGFRPAPTNNSSAVTQDIRHAFRGLRKQPGFSAIAVVTLALGIGANTAIFSIVNAVLLRPLPYPEADRIMVLNESSGPGQDYSVALPDYFDWRNDNTVFEHLAATHKESRNLSGIPGREPERISCASVTRRRTTRPPSSRARRPTSSAAPRARSSSISRR